MSDKLTIAYRVAGALLLYQCAMTASNSRLLWVIHSHAGIVGILMSAVTIGTLLMAAAGGVLLLLNRSKAPLFLVGSLVGTFMGGCLFPFVPFANPLLSARFGLLWILGINFVVTGVLLIVMIVKMNQLGTSRRVT